MRKQADIQRKFGKRVRELREAKGLSQEQLGFACDLSQTYISEVEAGKRNISLANIAALAQELGIPLSVLFDGVG